MGAGIAHALLLAGVGVVLVEADQSAISGARRRVTSSLEQSEARGGLSIPIGDVVSRLEVAASTEALAGAVLVIEAVPEDLTLKANVLAAIEDVVAKDAVIATNTSSLPVGELAAVLRFPERVLGLHFFNPVPASDLVEIVVAKLTRPGLVDIARDWIHQLGKTPIVVRDSPGFASSRLGVALGLEAVRMLEDGVATPEDIDTAMTLGYKHPIGPLRLTDLVGLDVRLDIAQHLVARLGPRFEPPALLVEKVERGELGRKSGRGFYVWDD
jgi:3-hydroxybutyryl-CoA dehydrogenase